MAGTETVTVLFTDLVGSTELSSRLGPHEADILRRVHFGLLRDAIEAAGGREVKNLGDGLMAVFRSVQAGLDSAAGAQVAIAGYNRRAKIPISVRIGLSNGDATEENGDYFGEPVIEAARLCASAQGDQILTTDMVRVMARRSGHRFVTERELELKGLPDPVLAWEVSWSLPQESNTSGIPLPAALTHRPTASLIGRAQEQTVLTGAYKAVAAGDGPRAVLIAGEAGMGKSTLVAAVTQDAHRSGAVVICGRCDEDLAIPYQPFVEALGHYVAHADHDALDGLRADYRDVLGRLVPDLRQGEAIGSALTDPDAERWLLYAAVGALLDLAAESEGGLVVVVEDLHWADRPTLSLLVHLLSALGPRVLLVGTYRGVGLSGDHPLTEALAALSRAQEVIRVPLGGLADNEVVSFVEAVAGHELDAAGVGLAHAVYRETDGNPFFVGEVLRHLVETRAVVQQDAGRWVFDADLVEAGLPDSVRQVIGARVERLGEEAAAVLKAAAVIGQQFDLELLARVVDTDEDHVLDLLEAAGRVALTREVPATTGCFRFRHALIQHTLYADLGPTRVARLHARVATALEAICGADPGKRVGELARHYLAAVRPADAARAVTLTQLAGEAALSALAPAEAADWFTRGLEVLGEGPDKQAERARILYRLGVARFQSGDPAYRETLLEAGRLAQRVGDVRTLLEAALANNRTGIPVAGKVDTERVALLEAAFEALGDADAPNRARLLAQLVLQRTWDGDYPGRRALADEALALARASGDRAVLLDVLLWSGPALSVPEACEELLGKAIEAQAVADEFGDLNLTKRYDATVNRCIAALQAGAFADIPRGLEVLAQLADTTGFPTFRWRTAVYRGIWVLLRGDAEGADQLATETLNLGQQTGQPDAMLAYGGQLATIRWHQGRLAEIADLWIAVVAETPGMSVLRAVLALTFVEAGREQEARAALAQESSRGFQAPYDHMWLAYLCLCAEAAAALGDADSAAVLYERLAPWPNLAACATVTSYGVVTHYLGALATVLGRFEEAEAHLAHALAVHEGIPAPFFTARTHLEWAKLLLARHGPGDRERADEHLRTAIELARNYGCALVEQRASALLGVQ